MLSERVSLIKPSATLAVTTRARELRAAGQDVIGLGAGEPDFDTPEHIKQAAIAALAAGDTKYTAVDGTPMLKQAIVDKFRRENDLNYEADQVIASCGAKQSLFNLFLAVLNPGDEVIVPAPYWVSYPDMVLLAGGKPVIVESGIDTQFKISAQQLSDAITPATKAIIINSPSNPSGVHYSSAEIGALGEALLQHPDVIAVTDDIYEHIQWTGESFANILNATPALKDRVVVINGVSKVYAMTGWRIGYAAGPAGIIGAMKKIQSQSTSNPSSVAQAAAAEALNGDQSSVAEMVAEFRRRHDRVVERLNAMPGVRAIPSDGTFYTLPDFSGAIESLNGIDDDLALAAAILEQVGVATVPGSAFGAPGHLRLSYATDMTTLESALERIEKFLTDNVDA